MKETDAAGQTDDPIARLDRIEANIRQRRDAMYYAPTACGPSCGAKKAQLLDLKSRLQGEGMRGQLVAGGAR